ncbi:hypothetical protein IAT38_007396 [Cryptococcus sp. DSM 104549]
MGHLCRLNTRSSLLRILGPSIIPVYKAALSGQRSLLYSTPPLLPLAAFAWCIWAISQPPTAAHVAERSIWLGNVGLMDLTELKAHEGEWIVTTSHVIYRSHPASYDLFIDLSSIPHSTPTPSPSGHALDQTFSTPTPPILSTYHQPSGNPTSVTYAFSDLPLYRSLLLLSSSPPRWPPADGYLRLGEGDEDAEDEDELVHALENDVRALGSRGLGLVGGVYRKGNACVVEVCIRLCMLSQVAR